MTAAVREIIDCSAANTFIKLLIFMQTSCMQTVHSSNSALLIVYMKVFPRGLDSADQSIVVISRVNLTRLCRFLVLILYVLFMLSYVTPTLQYCFVISL